MWEKMNPSVHARQSCGRTRRGPITKLETFFLIFFSLFLLFRRHCFKLPVEVLTLYWGAGAVFTWGRGVKSICRIGSHFLISPFFMAWWKDT